MSVKADDKFVAEIRGDSDPTDNSALQDDSRWALALRATRSTALSRATQLRAILLYLVQHAILQPNEPIHESEIAHRVLRRGLNFNPLDDNIVRVQIAHLRKKLDLYFSTEGKDEEVAITIALGTYLPIFTSRARSTSAAIQNIDDAPDVLEASGRPADIIRPERAPEPSETIPGVFPRKRALMWPTASIAVILVLAVTCVSLWLQNRNLKHSIQAMQRAYFPWKSSPVLAAFWSGFMDSGVGTDVVMSDAFFKLAEGVTKSSFTLEDYLSRNFVRELMTDEKSPEARAVLSKIAAWSSANTNHLNLARRILSLDPQGGKVHLYFARDYRPELIRQDNVILLGSRVTNPWDQLFDSRLNFIARPDSTLTTVITNRAPLAGEQASYTRNDSVGYCVVAYMPNLTSNGKVLLIEGTSVEATEAGGNFLFSENRMQNLQKRLNVTTFPYFEVLLKTSQVSGTPLTATIEAVRTYPRLR